MPNAVEPVEIISIKNDVRLRPIDEATVETLAKSIGTSGQLHPVIVHRDEHGATLIAGHHRYEALMRLGHTEIQALIFSNRLDAKIAALQENLARKSLRGPEKNQFIRQLWEALQERDKRDSRDTVSHLSDGRKAGQQHAEGATAIAAQMTGFSKRTIQRALKEPSPVEKSDDADADAEAKKLKAAVGRLLEKFDPKMLMAEIQRQLDASP